MSKSSTNSDKHPYMKLGFWKNNRFWNRPEVPQHVKDYYDAWLDNWESNERSLTKLNQHEKQII